MGNTVAVLSKKGGLDGSEVEVVVIDFSDCTKTGVKVGRDLLNGADADVEREEPIERFEEFIGIYS